ncbi:hypothetical protein HYQ46_011729 [Verticillium longisporum]|nr:hypothetical protein HYQ46_011729 [Verticillium longisporum]
MASAVVIPASLRDGEAVTVLRCRYNLRVVLLDQSGVLHATCLPPGSVTWPSKDEALSTHLDGRLCETRIEPLPPSEARNASTEFACILLVRKAEPILSLRVTRTPRPRALGLAASVTASRRFSGPSALMIVAGRIAPTKTIGLSVCTVRSTKKADSSRVSVPCVMTRPSQ